MSRRDCDVAIVGGGLVGASLACALAPLGYSVALIEAVPAQAAEQPSYDDRTLALGQASCRILEGLGLWAGLRDCATPIREIVVSERGRPGMVRLTAAELGLDAVGQVVQARAFGAAVQQRLASLAGVRMVCPARVTAWRAEADAAFVNLLGDGAPTELSAALVVAADGAASSVRRLAGIEAHEKDYGQTAVTCNVTPAQAHRGRAFERMTDTGPFAVLPHQGERCGLVWCVRSEQADELLTLPEDEFLRQASARFAGEIGPFLRMGRRSAHALKLLVPETDVLPRGLLVGNAAHTVHPAGAQGFNLGLRDVAVLAELLSASGPAGVASDPGAPGVLDAYSAWRRPDRDATVAWTDGLVSLFASPLGLSSTARTLGLVAHALLPPLRRRLACRAMGYRGRAPRLALGEDLLPPEFVAP